MNRQKLIRRCLSPIGVIPFPAPRLPTTLLQSLPDFVKGCSLGGFRPQIDDVPRAFAVWDICPNSEEQRPLPLPTSIRLQLQKLQKTPVLFHGTGRYDYVNHSDEIPLPLQGRAMTLTTCPDAALDDAIKSANGAPGQGAVLVLDAGSLRSCYDVVEVLERDVRRAYIEEPLIDLSGHLVRVLMVDEAFTFADGCSRPIEFERSLREKLNAGLLKARASVSEHIDIEPEERSRLIASLDELLADLGFGPRKWPMLRAAAP